MTDSVDPDQLFDFDAHKAASIEQYQQVRSIYEAYALVIRSILTQGLRDAELSVASVDARAKSLESFGNKVTQPAEEDSTRPKYPKPLTDITDLAGARVITFFLKTIEEIDSLISVEFNVLEKSDKSAFLLREERLGYQSVHYLVELKSNRTALREYSRFTELVGEIQVRTVLQHAWAEIEHDIQYKSVETIPSSIRRRFLALAGLLEIADREFQAVQKEDQELRERARESVALGNLEEVEITGDALKAYLAKKLGADGRMADWSYESVARDLVRLGFTNFREIDECIAPYDDDALSRAVYGNRQGQITRFETMLLASLGELYMEDHFLAEEGWWVEWKQKQLARIAEAGFPTGWYDPLADES